MKNMSEKEASLKPPTNRPPATDQLPTDQPTTGNQPPTKCTDHRPTDQQPIRNLRNRNQARIQCFKEVSQTDYISPRSCLDIKIYLRYDLCGFINFNTLIGCLSVQNQLKTASQWKNSIL